MSLDGKHKMKIESNGFGYGTNIYLDGKKMDNVGSISISVKPNDPVWGIIHIAATELDFKEEEYVFEKVRPRKEKN